jgi:hypothetical protein
VVRELTKAEQARAALIGTPGSVHTRHSSKPPKQYGPGFFGGRGFKWAFLLACLLSLVAFVTMIVVLEARHAEHAEESEQDPTTQTPGTDDAEESRDTSGISLGPADVALLFG